ncbi:WbqC family protein [Planctomycetota bacterium]
MTGGSESPVQAVGAAPPGERRDVVIGILQPGYIPWLGFFEQVYQSDEFLIFDTAQYNRSWRNRHRIRTPSGWRWLTVPVRTAGLGRQRICDVRICNNRRWAAHHWRCLYEHYHKAAYWSSEAPFFERLYLQDWERLVDLDMAIIRHLVARLGLSTPLRMVSALGLDEEYERAPLSRRDATARNIYFVEARGGTAMYEGASGRRFLDSARFASSGIRLFFQDFPHPVYPQQHAPFFPYLSALDVLFNWGAQSASAYLQSIPRLALSSLAGVAPGRGVHGECKESQHLRGLS